MPDQPRPPELPESGFIAPPMGPILETVKVADKTGRYWLGSLGMSSAPQLLAFLVVALLAVGGLLFGLMSWRMDGLVRGQIDEAARQNRAVMDTIEKRMDRCEQRHEMRDADFERERARQHEERQLASREREAALADRKAINERLRDLTAIMKSWQTPPKVSDKPDCQSGRAPERTSGGLPDHSTVPTTYRGGGNPTGTSHRTTTAGGNPAHRR